MSEVTRILERVEHGDGKAAEELLPLVYDELRKLAAHKMAAEPSGQTLQATSLVHEAWLRVIGQNQQRWESRAHFFIAASEAMRRILVERAPTQSGEARRRSPTARSREGSGRLFSPPTRSLGCL